MRGSRAALLVLLLAGCREPAPPLAAGLTDDAGVVVQLGTPPRRIVSLIPATTELVFALGAGERLVGRTSWCDFPAAAAAVPDLGNGIGPNIEAVVAARPDLVLLYKSGSNRSAAEQLRSFGIPTLELATDRMQDFDRITRLLGVALGKTEEAESLVVRSARDLDSATVRPSQPPTVFILAWDRPPMTLGRGSFLSEILERAGARNLFDDLATSSAPISIEAVASRNPDFVLVTGSGEPAIAGRVEWQVVPAVRQRRFLRIEGSEFNRPSPRIGEAVRKLAAELRGRHAVKAILILALLAALACLAGLALGAVPMSPRAILAALLSADAPGAAIVRDLRAPRVVLAFVVGGSLGVSGAALQALVRNPLADPYLLGISGGAGLAAVVAISLGFGGAWGVPAAAFVGGLGAIALVYRLSAVAGRRLDPHILVLAGVVVSAFTGALITAVLTLSPAEQLRNAFLWLLGGFSAASWSTVLVFAVYAVLPLLLLLGSARALDLLSLGEEPAQSLGLDAPRARRVVYLSTSLLTAASVAVCGVVGFVGLVAPHALRGLLGPLHRRLLPAVFLASGGFLVLADAAARTAARPIELPVGVVTALVGVPLFAVLLRRTLR